MKKEHIPLDLQIEHLEIRIERLERRVDTIVDTFDKIGMKELIQVVEWWKLAMKETEKQKQKQKQKQEQKKEIK